MNKILSIQVLRGIAASLVVFVHACHDTANVATESWFINFYNLPYFGYIGVDLFFIISGFIMILIHGNDFLKPKATSIFLIKRIIRIVPLYWIFTIFAASLLLIFPELFTKGKTFDFEQLIASLFFFPWYNSIGEVVPVLGVGWTLNFEMYFYIVFAFTLLLPKKYFLASISFIFIFGLLLFNILNVDFPYFLMIGKPILLEFLFGVYIGLLYRRKVILKSPKIWLSISLLLIINNIFMHFDVVYRVIYNGIPSAILIYALLSLEYQSECKYCNKYLIILGNASYSIYITHAFFYKGAIRLYEKLFGSVEPDLMILFSVLLSVFGGIFIYYVLEKPIYNFMKIKYSNYLTNKLKANNG
ncbi:MAG: acyltransferase family protein [Helicobacteraceae bacterium]|nr:acyltransferase family protein [Helicobacteraceae bacterium]